jgi:hypothetical protein
VQQLNPRAHLPEALKKLLPTKVAQKALPEAPALLAKSELVKVNLPQPEQVRPKTAAEEQAARLKGNEPLPATNKFTG